MTQTLRPADLGVAELEQKPLSPPSAEPLSGEILVRSAVAFANDTRTIVSSIWESDPGTSRWEFLTRGEIVHILAGRMVVTQDGGAPVELTAGSVAYYPIGWTGVWEVIEPVRKFYVVYR
ncbi:cupin domain-containing protein [Gryllotalpicola koreensis]